MMMIIIINILITIIMCFYNLLFYYLCFFFLQDYSTRIVRVINMFQNAHYKKPIIQELISRVLLEIEARGQVFCIALGTVIICIAIQTIGLLYLFYNT